MAREGKSVGGVLSAEQHSSKKHPAGAHISDLEMFGGIIPIWECLVETCINHPELGMFGGTLHKSSLFGHGLWNRVAPHPALEYLDEPRVIRPEGGAALVY